MKRRSLRFQLTAWYTAVVALTLGLAGAGVWWLVRQSIIETVDKDLRSRVESFRGFLNRLASDPDSGSLPEELAEHAAVSSAGTQYRVADHAGRWVYRSPGTMAWKASAAEPAKLPPRGLAETIWDRGKRYRMMSARAPIGLVQIAAPLDEFDEMLDQFTWTAILLLPMLLVAASAGGYWMSGRALAPVERITRTAEEIGARNLSRRLPEEGPGDELDRLSKTLNSMFARLETAFARMSQFTADASHELRTPVAIIRTTAEVTLAKPRGEQEYVRALGRILAESERTTTLLEDLMTLARSDLGADGVELRPMDLAETVRGTCGEARVLADASQVRMETMAPGECVIHGDASMLRRLLLILLDNAIKYTPAGGQIRVTLAANRSEATLTVADTGVGIGAEDTPHIFERFYRASKDRSRTTGGAGLGLSIARWIATCHRGVISVESVPGTGSSFHVRFPLERG
jgi:heavy metal sensor kinase